MDYTKLPNYKAAVAKYTNAVRTGASETAQSQAFDNMINTLETEIMEANTSNLSSLMTTQGTTTLTADETKFFNAVTSGTVGAEATIPQETLEQVFVELQNAHPLLDIITFQDAGLRMKAIISDSFASGGTALWGNVFGDITGQLNQAFREVDFSQSKLTAYLAIPKDALNNGYEWLKSFVILQLSEAIGVGLETALVTGDGFEKPIGLMKDLTKGTPALDGSVTYGDKEVFDDWSAITKENIAKTIAPAVEKLSKNENGVTVNLAGKVKLLVNPSDYYSTLAKFMHLTEDGKWVTVLPFGVEIIQSVAVPETKGVLFVSNRYWAYMGGASMQEFDQTLAIEDLQLYTVKSFYYGKAYDNNTALIVTVS